MKVSWIFKGKMKYGTILEIKGKGALVQDEKGKEKIRLLNTLNPVQEKEDDKKKDDKNEDQIKYFSNSKDYKWLSTFNKGEPFNYEGLTYSTVEHAFHAQKVNDDKKEEYQKLFINSEIEPNEAKKMGGKKYFQENNFTLRNDWDNVKLNIMEEIIREYYLNNPDMLEKLKQTGEKELVHTGFRIDDYWELKKERKKLPWKILMKIRNEL